MYSRNVSKKNDGASRSAPRDSAVRRYPAAKQTEKMPDKDSFEKNKDISKMPTDVNEKTYARIDLPPNYRGMITDDSRIVYPAEKNKINAEGITRLVCNDDSYCFGKESGKPKGDCRSAPHFSHMDAPFCSDKEEKEQPSARKMSDGEGLQRLANELRSRKFSPEDVLICAMILIMLNKGSEDDVLMILALMMLL